MLTIQIKDRLQTYLKSIGMSVLELEKRLQYSRRYFTNVHFNVPVDRIDQIAEALPGLNKQWLLTGKGSMTLGLSGEEVGFLDDPISMYARVVRLLERMGLRVCDYEAINGMPEGSIRQSFVDGDARTIDRIILDLLRTYPSYSIDWIYTGQGPAFRNDRRFVPVFDDGHELSEYFKPETAKSVNEKLDAPHKKENSDIDAEIYAKTYRVEAMMNLKYLNYRGEFGDADFGFVVNTDAMMPRIVYGDTVICRRLGTTNGIIYKRGAIGLLLTEDHSVKINYVESADGGQTILLRNAVSQEESRYGTDNFSFFAEVVGVIRKF